MEEMIAYAILDRGVVDLSENANLSMKTDFYRLAKSDPLTLARLMEYGNLYAFTRANLPDPQALAEKLKRRTDPVSEYLWQQFSSGTRQLLSRGEDLESSRRGSVPHALLLELNRLIQGKPIYDPQRFAAVALSERTRQLLGQKLQGEDVARLNRMLLEDAYPQELSRTPAEWLWQEMAAMFEHQLAAPIPLEIEALAPALASKLTCLQEKEGHHFRTFGDLLRHPQPPLDALRLATEFAEVNWRNPDSPMPYEIARVLYFACLAKTLVHTGRRIDRLEEAAGQTGFEWAAGLSWVDDSTKALFRQASRHLQNPKTINN